MAVAKTKQAKAADQLGEALAQEAPAAQLPAVAEKPAAPAPTVDVAPQTEGILPVTQLDKLASALSDVTAKIGSDPVHKGGRNTFHNYDYARMQDILTKLTPMMAEAGLTIMQSEITRGFLDNGAAVYVEYEFTVLHKSGQVWPQKLRQTGVCNARASNGKFDDKAINKCHTAARKYMLLALFQIPTTDDADADGGANDGGNYPQHGNDEQRAPPTSERRAQPKQEAPKAERQPVEWKEPFVIPTEGKKFSEWAAEYADRIKIAKDVDEIALWIELNSGPLNIMADDEKAARLYSRIQEIQAERRNELAARA